MDVSVDSSSGKKLVSSDSKKQENLAVVEDFTDNNLEDFRVHSNENSAGLIDDTRSRKRAASMLVSTENKGSVIEAHNLE